VGIPFVGISWYRYSIMSICPIGMCQVAQADDTIIFVDPLLAAGSRYDILHTLGPIG
jgi:hypothetical protein